MRRFAQLLALALLVFGAQPAAAERLVVSLSNHRVAVTSNFVGEELVLFGTIEPEPSTRALRPPIGAVLGLLFFFDRAWWLRAGLNHVLEPIGLGA